MNRRYASSSHGGSTADDDTFFESRDRGRRIGGIDTPAGYGLPPPRRKHAPVFTQSADKDLGSKSDFFTGPSLGTEISSAGASSAAHGLSYLFRHAVIDPHSSAAGLWRLIIFIATVYNIVAVPVRIAFYTGPSPSEIVFDYLFDALLLLNVLVSSRTAYFVRGVIVRDPRLTSRRYRTSGTLYYDLLSAIPLDIFLLLTVEEKGHAALLRLTRLLRIVDLPGFFRLWEKRVKLNPVLIRLCKLAFWIVFVSHTVACLWWIVGMASIDDRRGSWIRAAGLDGGAPRSSSYIRSFYWATLTLTTTGYGDIKPLNAQETVFSVFTMLVGQSVYAYIIGNMSSLIANANQLAAQFKSRLDIVNTYIRYRKLPKDLATRVRNYYIYLWESHKGVDERDILSGLPTALARDVSMCLNAETVRKVPIFSDVDDNFLAALVSRLVPLVAGPADIVIREGEIGDSMYFISRGEVAVMSGDERIVYTKLGAGSFFGEISLLTNERRTATIRATTFCDLFVLSMDDFDEAVEGWDGYRERMNEVARARVKTGSDTDSEGVVDVEAGELSGADGGDLTHGSSSSRSWTHPEDGPPPPPPANPVFARRKSSAGQMVPPSPSAGRRPTTAGRSTVNNFSSKDALEVEITADRAASPAYGMRRQTLLRGGSGVTPEMVSSPTTNRRASTIEIVTPAGTIQGPMASPPLNQPRNARNSNSNTKNSNGNGGARAKRRNTEGGSGGSSKFVALTEKPPTATMEGEEQGTGRKESEPEITITAAGDAGDKTKGVSGDNTESQSKGGSKSTPAEGGAPRRTDSGRGSPGPDKPKRVRSRIKIRKNTSPNLNEEGNSVTGTSSGISHTASVGISRSNSLAQDNNNNSSNGNVQPGKKSPVPK